MDLQRSRTTTEPGADATLGGVVFDLPRAACPEQPAWIPKVCEVLHFMSYIILHMSYMLNDCLLGLVLEVLGLGFHVLLYYLDLLSTPKNGLNPKTRGLKAIILGTLKVHIPCNGFNPKTGGLKATVLGNFRYFGGPGNYSFGIKAIILGIFEVQVLTGPKCPPSG